MRVLIVGAGPGGLTTALALQRAGIQASVFERAADLGQLYVGSGIHVWPNGMRSVRRIADDVFEGIRAAGARERSLEIRVKNGKVVSRWPLEEFERKYGAPTVGITRSDLLRVLYEGLEDDSVHFGASFREYRRLDGKVVVELEDGSEEADVLIGADGLRSAVRRQMLGDEAPRYSGYSVSSAYVELNDERIPSGVLHQVWGRGARFIFYRLHGDTVAWFAIRNAEPVGMPTGEARKKELLAVYESWHEPIGALVESTPADTITESGIYDRKPVERWTDGPVALLGDAAHPLTMNIGQGVALAVEDAVVLTRCLRGEESTAAALQSYERQRVGRTREISSRSWRIGKLGSRENRLICAARDRLLFPLFGGRSSKQTERMIAHDA